MFQTLTGVLPAMPDVLDSPDSPDNSHLKQIQQLVQGIKKPGRRYWSNYADIDNTLSLILNFSVNVLQASPADLLDVDVFITQATLTTGGRERWIIKPTVLIDHPTYAMTDDGLSFSFDGISKRDLTGFLHGVTANFYTPTYAACVKAHLNCQPGAAEQPCTSCPKQLICLGTSMS